MFRLNIGSIPIRQRTESWIYRKWLDSERRTLYGNNAMLENLLARAQDRLSQNLPAVTLKRHNEIY